jgi:polar amino acid transport system substrate-binding protein
MLKRVLCAAILAALTAACVPPVDKDAIEQFSTLTTMGQAQKRGFLRVGIDVGSPPFGYIDDDGRIGGFTADLGRLIAQRLGVRAELVAGGAADISARLNAGSIDVGFPMSPIDQRILAFGLFSDPYYIAHQRLLVPPGSQIEGIDDLAGRRVCQQIAPPAGIDIARLAPAAKVTDAASPSACLGLLENHRADAVTALDLDLVQIQAADPAARMVGDDLTTAGFGAMVRRDSGGFNGFIDLVLSRAEDNGDWQRFYDKWVRPLSRVDEGPPNMSFETAAALFPAK